MSRKRSSDDIEDADECLPISKRINSLHIEGQRSQAEMQASGSQQVGNEYSQSNTEHPGMVNPMQPPYMGIPQANCSQHLPRIEENSNASSHNVSGYPELNEIPHHLYSSLSDPYSGRSDNAPGPSLPNNPSYDRSQMNLGSNLSYPNCSQSSHTANQSILNSHLYPQQDQNQWLHRNGHESHAVPGFSSTPPPGSSSFGVSEIMSNNNAHSFQVDQQQSQLLGPPGPQFPENFHYQQIPNGPYQPELGASENPHYYSMNKILYEAHISRVRRIETYGDSS